MAYRRRIEKARNIRKRSYEKIWAEQARKEYIDLWVSEAVRKALRLGYEYHAQEMREIENVAEYIAEKSWRAVRRGGSFRLWKVTNYARSDKFVSTIEKVGFSYKWSACGEISPISIFDIVNGFAPYPVGMSGVTNYPSVTMDELESLIAD